MIKRRKADIRTFRSLFSLIFPAVAACLISLLSSSDAMCADDDDFLISLPDHTGDNQLSSISLFDNHVLLPLVRPEDRLPGVIYDFTQTSGHRPTNLLGLQSPASSDLDYNAVPFFKKFVLGGWAHRTDAKGNLFYTELNHLHRSPLLPDKSYFYQEEVPSDRVIKTFYEEAEDIPDSGWCSIHAGYLVAPFTGRFRFVGFGDDILVVRFNRQLVFDYGWYAVSIGALVDPESFRTYPGGKPPTDQTKRILPDRGLYSTRLDTYFPTMFHNHGVAKGAPISVVKGRVYPIEILYSNFTGNACVALFVERLDSNSEPFDKNPKKLPLFRTTLELPPHPASGDMPDFDDDSPIWKVVDGNGKPIPSRNPASAEPKKTTSETQKSATSATSAKTSSGTKKKDSAASASAREKQASEQPKRDSSPVKTVSTSKRGNVTTQTVTERQGDTTIETVTTTEVNGDTTVQTTVITETKNGKVVKKTTSTSTTMSNPAAKTDSAASKQPAQTKTGSSSSGASSSSEKKTDSSAQNGKLNPFGSPQRPREEDD